MGKFFFAISRKLLRPPTPLPNSRAGEISARAGPAARQSLNKKTAGLDAPIRTGRALKIRREEGFGSQ
jgi:hypothetical protein